MKYRSYNSEIIIATTLLVDVFNDIIIDRRKHGLKRDFSKAVSLNEIVQQKIEIPCILGDRSIILKSLENEPGKYKLPLIILQNKSLKTDTNRMCDLHSDVFYQEDSQFSKLSVSNHLYRPQQISKKRGQPIIIDYDMTIIAKYKEDLDQILSNWAVHFRPDIYVKWWHPRNKENTLTSQILWSHNISYDAPVEYNPQNIFTYKFTTSFSFKSWLFYGMHSIENSFIDGGIIKKIKLFPNKSKIWDDNDLVEGEKDSNDWDDAYVFGQIENKNISDLSFYTVDSEQEFYNKYDNDDDLKNGKFIVENVFAENNPIISSDQILSNIKNNDLVGDFFGSYNKHMINESNKLFLYLIFDDQLTDNQAVVKNVYFKGGYLKENMFASPPSGDFMFDTFYKLYNKNEKSFESEFGQSLQNLSKIDISYNINDKNLIITSKYSDNKYVANFKNVLNSSNGIIQEFSIESKLNINKIGMIYHKEYNKDFIENKKGFKFEKYNVKVFNELDEVNNILLKADLNSHKITVMKILNLIKSLWNSINLIEQTTTRYEMQFEDVKFKEILIEKSLDQINFRTLTLINQSYLDNYYYYVLCNNYIYVVLKIDANDENNIDIYDIGPFVELTLQQKHEIIYEITIPESKMLLGLNFYMKY